MAFDLARIRTELAESGPPPPYPAPLAAAVVADCFRLAKIAPPPARTWHAWAEEAGARWEEQLGMLAHLLRVTSLREETVRALGAAPPPESALASFFAAVEPLTSEMIRTNPFRQEEFLRRWVEAVGGRVQGEDAKASRRRLEQLDYRKTLAEYDRAEKARKEEAKRRARLLAEAAQREADARGWRE